jgi:hypothetical protein
LEIEICALGVWFKRSICTGSPFQEGLGFAAPVPKQILDKGGKLVRGEMSLSPWLPV